jgi:hypothetical protein
MIRVVNKKTHKPTPDDFYIGRGSVMGNPYHHKESKHPQALYKVDTAEEAIDGYKKDFINCYFSTDEGFKRQVQKLIDRELDDQDTNLVCYCAPNKCHGDVIKKFVEDYVSVIRWKDFI